MSDTLTKKKTAPKKSAETTLIENPQISMSEYDCVTQKMNTAGDAIIVSLSLFAGSPEEIAFTPEGEKEKVEYDEVGGIELDDVFELLDGTKVRFRVIKAKKRGQSDRLVIRPVSETGRKGKAKPQF